MYPFGNMTKSIKNGRVDIALNANLRSDVVVIGSGPGGSITADLLSEAGFDVVLVEEGPYIPVGATKPYSREEISLKYRNSGITVGMGKAKVVYAEGRCVGGASEINRGLYYRISPETLEKWSRQFKVDAFTHNELKSYFDACEKRVCVSPLPGATSPISLKLHEGATKLGWNCVEVSRLYRYTKDPKDGHFQELKQSMSATVIPRFISAGGRLLSNTRVLRLSRNGTEWTLNSQHTDPNTAGIQKLEITAKTVFVACGATQTPLLLRRSGITRNIGNSFCFHPMVKVIASFPEKINIPGSFDPVHQIKEFDPKFSMGCSTSPRSMLALMMTDHPSELAAVDKNWEHMGIYYVQTTGGRGNVRNLPGFSDPWVRMICDHREMTVLAEGLKKLCICLFQSGATALYPSISGSSIIRSNADLNNLPTMLPYGRTCLTTLHLFSSCPMGEDQTKCATNSFGKVFGVDNLYIADSSLLCGPTIVNPQGTIMATAYRNASRFIEYQTRHQKVRRLTHDSGITSRDFRESLLKL